MKVEYNKSALFHQDPSPGMLLESQRVGCSPAACSAVWVVVGETGEYSDYSEWNVAAFTDERQAEAFKDACQREAEKANGKDYKLRNGFRHAYDTQFYCDYTGTKYRIDMVQVFDSFTPNV